MWTKQVQIIVAEKVQKISIWQSETPITFRQFIELLQNNEAFRKYFVQLLKDAPFEAYFWETPPITNSLFDRPFEFVFYKSNALARINPNATAFQEHYVKDVQKEGVLSFFNLGRDALLVVPVPIKQDSDFAHIAAFVRHAPHEQQLIFWQKVAIAVLECLNEKPIWLSTSGLGVSWLHMRIDNRPKYYQFKDFKYDDNI